VPLEITSIVSYFRATLANGPLQDAISLRSGEHSRESRRGVLTENGSIRFAAFWIAI
jgi:hypothetical protein